MRSTESGRCGLSLPVLGQGTWRMGEVAAQRRAEVAALQFGIELGLNLIDTAEMYGDGGAEEVVAEAIDGRRDDVFLVSKVLPHNASKAGTIAAAEASLNRLRTDRLELYLLHWPGSHPLEETYAAFEQLLDQGKVRYVGVSNFDMDWLARSERTALVDRIVTNQVLYNVERRGVEARLLPWCRKQGMLVMAYSPLEQARLQGGAVLERLAAKHGCTSYQVALAWVLRHPQVMTIPKATTQEHIRQNVAALDVGLDADDLAQIDAAFPAPGGNPPLEVL